MHRTLCHGLTISTASSYRESYPGWDTKVGERGVRLSGGGESCMEKGYLEV